MLKEAAEAGFYKSPHLEDKIPAHSDTYGRAVAQWRRDEVSALGGRTFKKAPKVREKEAETMALPLGNENEDE
jgi:hypothetical protein